MGQEAVKLAERTPHFDLVGAIDHTYDQQKLSDVMPNLTASCPILPRGPAMTTLIVSFDI